MKPDRILKGFILALLIAFGAYLFVRYDLYIIWTDPQRFVAFIESFHPYDDIVFIAFQTFQVLLAGALPAELSGIAGGYMYGPVVGTIYSTIGLSTGSWLAFMLARIYGLPLVRKVVRPSLMEKYDHFMTERGAPLSFICFIIPGFPKAALCYILGLSAMRVWTFIGISTVGRMFGTILLSISGSSIRHKDMYVVFVITGLLIVGFVLAYIYRKKLIRLTERRKPPEDSARPD